jgi:filamentous hemagglutinin family protein
MTKIQTEETKSFTVRTGGRKLTYVVRPRRRFSSLLKFLIAVFGGQVVLWPGMAAAQGLSATALPTGGAVQTGAATIGQAGNAMTVNQTSSKVIINYSTFNIGKDASVTFTQPSASSVALNQVVGSADPSQILGRLSSNGQVWIQNAGGVYFGTSAVVDVGGMLATSLKVNNDQFMNGNTISMEKNGSAGAVVNEGVITAKSGGYVALIAPSVTNAGVINAPMGTVRMAGGDKVTVDLAGDGLIKLNIDKASANAVVTNAGYIGANGGTVVLSARSAGDLASLVVNNTGIIEAKTISERGGKIFLDGGTSGITESSGSLIATGEAAGTKGGAVQMAGALVGVTGSGKVDVSGDAGGGTALIGGNYQGKDTVSIIDGSAVANARVTDLRANATIKANATGTGNGGKVIVWADETANVSGAISARGGATGGDGGLIETSGKRVLNLNTGYSVSASAANGKSGAWLVDPQDIEITNTATAAASVSPGAYTNDGTATKTNILNTDIQNVLETGTDVIVFTSGAKGSGGLGNITVKNNITMNSGFSKSAVLTLAAAHDVIVETNVTISSGGGDKLGVTLAAGNNTDPSNSKIGSVVMKAGSSILTGGGNVVVGGGDNAGSGYAQAGALAAGVSLATGAVIDAGTGSIDIRGVGSSAVGGGFGVSLDGASLLTSTGAIRVTGTGGNNASGNNVGVQLLNAAKVETTGGNITLDGTSTALAAASDLGISLGGSSQVNALAGTVTLNAKVQGAAALSAIAESGTAKITAATLAIASAGNVLLGNTNNDVVKLQGTVAKGGAGIGSLTYVDFTGLDVGATGVAGNLDLSTKNAITNSGIVTVGGTTVLKANNQAIALNNAGNDFTGAVSANSVTDLDLADTNSIVLGDINATATVKVATGALGGITQLAGSSLTSAGSTTLKSGSAGIVAANAGNDFGSGVGAGLNLNAVGGAINVADKDALTILSLASGTDKAVTIVAGTNLTTSTDAITAGTQNVSLAATAGLLTLNGSVSGTTLNLTGATGITLTNSINVTSVNDTTMTSTGGAVSQTVTSALKVGTTTGTLTVSANKGIDLQGTNNQITQLAASNSGAGVAGNINVVSKGNASTADFAIAGVTNATAAGSISLTNSTPSTGAISTNAGSTISSSNGAVSLKADLMTLSSAGGATLTAGSGNVQLQTFSANRNILLRTADTSGGTALWINTAFLPLIATTSQLTIGNNTSGSFTVLSPITMLAGSASTLSFVNGSLGAMNIGAAVTTPGILNLTSGSNVLGNGQITAATLNVSADSGITLTANGAGNNVGAVTLSNASLNDILYINNYSGATSTIAANNQAVGGSVTVTEKASALVLGNVISNNGAITVSGAPNQSLTLSAGKVIDATNAVVGGAGNKVTIRGDQITLDGTVKAGKGVVALTSASLDRTIDIGGLVTDVGYTNYFGTVSNAAQLNITSASLTNIASASGIEFGESTHTGDVIVSAAFSRTASNLTLRNNGLIDIGAAAGASLDTVTSGNLTLDASTSGGRIGNSFAGTLGSAGGIFINSYGGAGDITAPVDGLPKPLLISAAATGISAINSNAGDLYVSVLNNSKLTLSGVGGNIVQGSTGGTTRVDAAGDIYVNGDITAFGGGSANVIDLRSQGAITRNTAGTNTIKGTSVYLQANTGIGLTGVGNQVNVQASNVSFKNLGATGGVFIADSITTGTTVNAASTNAAGTSGDITLTSASGLTVSDTISNASGNILLQTGGATTTLQLNRSVIAAGSLTGIATGAVNVAAELFQAKTGPVLVEARAGTGLSITGGRVSNGETTNLITLRADAIDISNSGRVESGVGGTINVQPFTNGRNLELGNGSSVIASNAVILADSELDRMQFGSAFDTTAVYGAGTISLAGGATNKFDRIVIGQAEVISQRDFGGTPTLNRDFLIQGTGSIEVRNTFQAGGINIVSEGTGTALPTTVANKGIEFVNVGAGVIGVVDGTSNVTLNAQGGAILSAKNSAAAEVLVADGKTLTLLSKGGIGDRMNTGSGTVLSQGGTVQAPNNSLETQAQTISATNASDGTTDKNAILIRNHGTFVINSGTYKVETTPGVTVTVAGSSITNSDTDGAIYLEATTGTGYAAPGDLILAGAGVGGKVLTGTGDAPITVNAARDVVFAQGNATTPVIGIYTGAATVTARAGRDIVGNLANRTATPPLLIDSTGKVHNDIAVTSDQQPMVDIRSTAVGPTLLAVDLQAVGKIGAAPDNCNVTCAPIELDVISNGVIGGAGNAATSGQIRAVTTGTAVGSDGLGTSNIAVFNTGNLWSSQFATLGTAIGSSQALLAGSLTGTMTVDSDASYSSIGGTATSLPNTNGDAFAGANVYGDARATNSDRITYYSRDGDIIIASAQYGKRNYAAGRDVVQTSAGVLNLSLLGARAGRHIVLDQANNVVDEVALASGASNNSVGSSYTVGDVNFKNTKNGDWLIGNSAGFCGFDWTTGISAGSGNTNGTFNGNIVLNAAPSVAASTVNVTQRTDGAVYGGFVDATAPGIVRYATITAHGDTAGNGGLALLGGTNAGFTLSMAPGGAAFAFQPKAKAGQTPLQLLTQAGYDQGTSAQAIIGNSINILAANTGGAVIFRNAQYLAVDSTNAGGVIANPVGSSTGNLTIGVVSNASTTAGVSGPVAAGAALPSAGPNTNTAPGYLTTSTTGISAGGNVALYADRSAASDIKIVKNISSGGSTGQDKGITVQANRDINVTAGANVTATNAGGNITFYSDREVLAGGRILIGDGTTASTVATNGGNVVLGGGDAAVTTGGDMSSTTGFAQGRVGATAGVLIQKATVTASTVSGSGSVTIRGKGDPTPASAQFGVSVVNGGSVATSGGALSITGSGGSQGAGASEFNYGVYVGNSIGSSTISTVTGPLSITGYGGGESTNSKFNWGVVVEKSTVQSTGAALAAPGAVNILGIGGLGNGVFNGGVLINGSSGLVSVAGAALNITGSGGNGSSAAVGVGIGAASGLNGAGTVQSTGGGAITISGVGGSAGSNNNGVLVGNGGTETGTIDSQGGGAINVVGTGGSGAGGGNTAVLVTAQGVIKESNAALASGGNVDIKGFAGAGDGSVGVSIQGVVSSANATAAGGGNITITGLGAQTASAKLSHGVLVSGATGKVTSVASTIGITGSGYSAATGQNLGVSVASGALISSATGAIAITGTGGGSTAAGKTSDDNDGVQINASTVTMTGNGGGITVIGQRGGNLSKGNDGVQISAASVVANASSDATNGNVNITGLATGGTALTSDNDGVNITGAGTQVTTNAGTLTLLGTGAGTTSDNYGVGVQGGATVATTTGNLQITGQGAAGTSFDDGVRISAAGSLVQSGQPSTSPASNILGTAGAGSAGNSNGIRIDTLAIVEITGALANGTLNITGSGAGTGDNNMGVRIDSAILRSVGATGSTVFVSGAGSTTGTNNNIGVQFNAGTGDFAGVLKMTGSGGGTAAGVNNDGIFLGGSTGASTVTARNSDSTLAGYGGAAVNGGDNSGVVIGSGSTLDFKNTTGAVTALVSGVGGTGTGGNNKGVSIGGRPSNALDTKGGFVNVSGATGALTVSGLGGGGDSSQGVYVGSSTVASTLTNSGGGVVQLIGTGGSTGHSAQGVRIVAETAVSRPTLTNSGGGTLGITGTGGGKVAGLNEHGVIVQGALVQSTTAATGIINISGTGGAGAAGTNEGVVLRYSAAAATTANITDATTGGGTINISGAGGAGPGSYGVELDGLGNSGGAQVSQTAAAGTANIRITGTSATADGVYMRNGATISSASTNGVSAAPAAGAIQVTGTSDAGGFYGFDSTNALVTAVNANVFISGVSANTTTAGVGGVKLDSGTSVTVTGVGATVGNICISGASSDTTVDSILLNAATANVVVSNTGTGSYVSLIADPTRGRIRTTGTAPFTASVAAPNGTVSMSGRDIREEANSQFTGTNLVLQGSGLFDIYQAGNDFARVAATITHASGGLNDTQAVLLYQDATGFDVATINYCVTCTPPNTFTTTAVAGLQVGSASLTAGGNEKSRITLKANGDVRQETASPVVTSKLTVLGGTSANYYFANVLAGTTGTSIDNSNFTTNDVDVIVGNLPGNGTTTATGNLQYRDKNGFTVSSVTGGLATAISDPTTTGITAAGNIALLADVGADSVSPDIAVTTLINRATNTGATQTLLRANRDIIIRSVTDETVTATATGAAITTTGAGKQDLTLQADANQPLVANAAEWGGRVLVGGKSTTGGELATIATNGGTLSVGGAAFTAGSGLNTWTVNLGTMKNAQGRANATTSPLSIDDGVSFQFASVTTTGGNVTIRGAGDAPAVASTTVGRHYGVELSFSTMSTDAGSISITGTGGNGSTTPATGDANSGRNFGVYVQASTVTSTDGSINVTGSGGNSIGANDNGIVIASKFNQAAITGPSTIQSGSGTQTYLGVGSGSGGSSGGVTLFGDSIVRSTTASAGAISVTGIASTVPLAAGAGSNIGVTLGQNAAGVPLPYPGAVAPASSGTITSTNGNITVTGSGGTGTDNNIGVLLRQNSLVSNTVAGNVTILGTGIQGNTASGVSNIGVLVQGSSIGVNSGDLLVVGSATSSNLATQFNDGVNVQYSAITNASTVAKILTISGVGDANALGLSTGTLVGSFNRGVLINASTVSANTTATANDELAALSILGTAGAGSATLAGGVNNSVGVQITSSGSLSAGSNNGVPAGRAGLTQILSDAGALRISGTGGGTADGELGVGILGSTGPIATRTTVASQSGDLSITGVASTTGINNNNRGVTVFYSSVSTQAGNLLVTGTASTNATGLVGSNFGVLIDSGTLTSGAAGAKSITISGSSSSKATGTNNTGVLITNTVVGNTGIVSSTAAAPINISGAAGGGSNSNNGVAIVKGAGDTSTVNANTGVITIVGNPLAGTTYTGSGNNGIVLDQSTISTTAANIFMSGTGGAGTRSNNGVYVAGSSIKTATVSAGTSGTLLITGLGAAASTAAGNGDNNGVFVADFSLVQVKDGNMTVRGTGGNGDQGNSGILLSGDASANLLVQSTGNGSIDMTGLANGLGNAGGVVVSEGAVVLVASPTSTGNITITGTGSQNGTANMNVGVYVGTMTNGKLATVSQQGTGFVTIQGTGGKGDANDNVGVWVDAGGQVIAGVPAGSVSITGTGGNTTAGSGSNNYGVEVRGLVESTSTVVTVAGTPAVSITGTGANGANNNNGVYLQGGKIASASQDIFVTGSGRGTGGANRGVALVADAGGDYVQSTISSSAANIQITGTGGINSISALGDNAGVLVTTDDGAGSGANPGLSAVKAATISANKALTITGISVATGGSTNDGVRVTQGGTLTAATGDVIVSGVGGTSAAGTDNRGVALLKAGKNISTINAGAGNLTVVGVAGAGTNGNIGAYVENSRITSGADQTKVLLVQGTAKATAAGDDNRGVKITGVSSTISSANALITITGTGAGGTFGDGVAILGDSTGSPTIQNTGGAMVAGTAITIKGSATTLAAATADDAGVRISGTGVTVSNTQDYGVLISGVGGGGSGSAINAYGVLVQGGSNTGTERAFINSKGPVTITGVAGGASNVSGGNDVGVRMAQAVIAVTGAAGATPAAHLRHGWPDSGRHEPRRLSDPGDWQHGRRQCERHGCRTRHGQCGFQRRRARREHNVPDRWRHGQ